MRSRLLPAWTPGTSAPCIAGINRIKVNNLGQVAGVYNEGKVFTAFLYENGITKTAVLPFNSISTFGLGFNDFGKMIGNYVKGAETHPFIYDFDKGTFANLNAPPNVVGINNSGEIAGISSLPGFTFSAFLYVDGAVRQSAVLPEVRVISNMGSGFNDNREVAANYGDISGKGHAFIYNFDKSSFVSFDPPGQITNINNLGQVAGLFYKDGTEYVFIGQRSLPKYKLVASVKNAEVINNGPPLLVRVDPSNLHLCNADILPDVKTKAIHVECKDDKGNPVNGCQFRIVGDFPSDANDGGHDRSNHPPRPTQLFAEAFPMNFVPIDVAGTDFSYKVPDASGEVDLRILGKGPNSEDLDPFVIRVRVQTKGLVPINAANLGFVNLDTHAAGKYGTAALNDAVAAMITNFRAALALAKVLPQNMPSLKSEGANLPWGGLFDIGEDHLTPGWSEPHCGHRGNNIDITVSDLSKPEKDALQKAIRKATLTTPYEPESPGFNDSHWHLQK